MCYIRSRGDELFSHNLQL